MIRRPPRSTLFPSTPLFRSLRSVKRGVTAGPDPWKGNTLEWFTTSPPPVNNFDVVPRVRSVEPMKDIRREVRSEEHTSELQSRQYLVCRLLLEKKKHNRVSG